MKEVNMSEVRSIKQSIKDFNDQIVSYNSLIQIKSRELFEKALYCKEILNEAEWKFDNNILHSDTSKHKQLANFLETDYHCYYENEEAMLFFDDNKIKIFFKNPDNIYSFISKMNIRVDTNSLQKQYEYNSNSIIMHQKTLKEIEEILSKLGQ